MRAAKKSKQKKEKKKHKNKEQRAYAYVYNIGNFSLPLFHFLILSASNVCTLRGSKRACMYIYIYTIHTHDIKYICMS